MMIMYSSKLRCILAEWARLHKQRADKKGFGPALTESPIIKRTYNTVNERMRIQTYQPAEIAQVEPIGQ